MTAEERAELRRLAKAIRNEPFFSERFTHYSAASRYIDAANPHAVLELLDEVEVLETRCAQLELERERDLLWGDM